MHEKFDRRIFEGWQGFFQLRQLEHSSGPWYNFVCMVPTAYYALTGQPGYPSPHLAGHCIEAQQLRET
jgi:hypothetical protein